jgi:hypothetical protein
LDSEYEPVITRFEAESTVHPSDFQPAGRETEGEGAADDVDVRTAVDDGVVVGPAEVVEVVEGAEDGDDEEEPGTRASFWKMLILYPPPQTLLDQFAAQVKNKIENFEKLT